MWLKNIINTIFGITIHYLELGEIERRMEENFYIFLLFLVIN